MVIGCGYRQVFISPDWGYRTAWTSRATARHMGWMDGTGMAFTVIKAGPRRPQNHLGQKYSSNRYTVSQRIIFVMRSEHEDTFRITVPLRGEFTVTVGFHTQGDSVVELWHHLRCKSEKVIEQTGELTGLFLDAMTFMWRYCNVYNG